MSEAIAKAKEQMGLVETVFLSKRRQGVTTAMRIFTDALGREGRYYAAELNTTLARGGPLIHALRIGNSSLLPHATSIQPDHVVMLDWAKMTDRDPTVEEVLFNFPTGLLIVNTKRTPEELEYGYPFEGHLITVDVTEIAEGMTSQRPAPPKSPLWAFTQA